VEKHNDCKNNYSVATKQYKLTCDLNEHCLSFLKVAQKHKTFKMINIKFQQKRANDNAMVAHRRCYKIFS